MRWLQLILSFIVKRFSTVDNKSYPIEDIKEYFKENALKLFVGMVLIISLGTLISSGLYMAINSIMVQIDLGKTPKLTAISWGGILMFFIPSIILGIIWYLSMPHERRKRKRQEEISSPTLEHAVMLLVTDFIEERQMKRQFKYERERRILEEEFLREKNHRQNPGESHNQH